MTSTFLAEANKLKHFQNTLEKSLQVYLQHFSKQDQSASLKDFYNEIENERATDIETTQNETKTIFSSLNQLKTQIQENIPALDLNMLKKDMITTQTNIQNVRYKHKTMLEKLEKEEKELLSEMQAFEEKFAQWDTRSSVILNAQTRPKETKSPETCPEVGEFVKFVAESRGHEGGWTPEDHNLFLKIRNKYKNPRQTANCVHALCPDLTIQDVTKHEEWYKKYLSLKEKQKEVIRAWRENRNKEREVAEMVGGKRRDGRWPIGESDERKEFEKNGNEKKNEKTENEKKMEKEKNEAKKKEREFLQEKITHWKKQKETRQLVEAEERAKEEHKKKETEEKKREEGESLKMEVMKWKREKVVQIQEDKIKKELAELKEKEYRTANAKRLIKQFQSQDDFFVRRMQRSRKSRSKSLERFPFEKLPLGRLPNKNILPRDPERLLKPTKQWLFRTMPRRPEDDVEAEPKPVCNVRSLQKLGVPMWRKCI